MDTIIIKTKPSKTKALIQILKAFDIAYEVKKDKQKSTTEEPYDPAFVKMVLERSKNAHEGDTTRINPEDLWGSLGLK